MEAPELSPAHTHGDKADDRETLVVVKVPLARTLGNSLNCYHCIIVSHQEVGGIAVCGGSPSAIAVRNI